MVTRGQVIGFLLLGFAGILWWLPDAFWSNPEYSRPRGLLLVILIPLAGWLVFDRWKRVAKAFEETDA